MYFKQILNERCGCASYLIASRQSREAVLVDPAIGTPSCAGSFVLSLAPSWLVTRDHQATYLRRRPQSPAPDLQAQIQPSTRRCGLT